MDKQVHKFRGKRFSRHLRFAPVRLDSLMHTSPEIGVRDLKLVAQDMAPDARTVGGSINRVGDPGTENATVREVELVCNVMSARTTSGISHWSPVFHLAELFVKLPGRLRPGHRSDPTSH